MATVASLQIKIGADVSAAINGLSKAQFAADQVKEAYIEANAATVTGGFVVAGWAQNFSTAIKQVQSNLEKVDLSKLDGEQKESTSNMLQLASGALRVTESISTAAAAFSGMQAIAGPAIAGIAALFPALGTSIAALAGPIGIAVGVLAAGAALIVSNWDLVAGAISETETVTLAANKATAEQKAKTLELVDVLKNEVSTRKEQKEAISKLNEISPTYFGGLTKEKLTVDQLNTAYKAYATNLDNIAKLQAINNEVSALYQSQVQTQIALQDATAKATQEQLKYNSATASAREGTKNELPLTLAKNTVAAEKEKLATINAQIAKYKDLGKAIPPVTREPDSGKGSTKNIETEGDKIQKVLDTLENKLALIQVQFKNNLIPDDFGPQVDAIQDALSKIGEINPNSSAFQKLLNDYKAFANQNPLEIPVSLGKINVASLASVDQLPDRLSDVAKKMQSAFVNTNPFLALEAKAAQAKAAVQSELEKIAEIVNVAGNTLSSALSVVGTFEQNSITERTQELDAYYEKQKTLIESQVNDEGLKNKKLEALEKDVATKRKAIKRDEAAGNKRNSIFNAIINTAQAVTSALATGGPVLATIVGAIGAAQVAAIAATPLPALQSGALVSGRNTVVVGEYAGADNNPELISPVNKVQKYITEAVQNSGGGGAQQLYSFISGDDIMLVSERGAYRKSRVG